MPVSRRSSEAAAQKTTRALPESQRSRCSPLCYRLPSLIHSLADHGELSMNILLWVLQILAALLYASSGVMKVFLFDKVSKTCPSSAHSRAPSGQPWASSNFSGPSR